jgi:hypothetical protein
MVNLFTDKMSSSEKRDIQRKLERGSRPPRISTGFSCVNPEGYLDVETTRLLNPSSSIPPSPRAKQPKRVDRVFDGDDHIGETGRRPRRRPSIETRTRKSEYHTLLEGRSLWSDDEVTDDVDRDVQEPPQSKSATQESSSVPEPQLALPILEPSVDSPRPSIVSVLCGRQDPKSWYLTRRLARVPTDNAATNLDAPTLLTRRNIDPDAAELHRLWRHTGVIPTRYRDVKFDPDGVDPQHSWITCWPLINAAIHGYLVEDVEFVDRVMDLVDEKVLKGVRPDFDTISHIFGDKRHHMPMALGRFLVDRWVDSAAEGFGNIDLFNLPRLFVYVALETAMRRLSQEKRSSSLTGCQYHTHTKPEECYRNRDASVEAKRQERYQYRREKASREAENVATDSIACGIATVDWEERRVEEHRRLRNRLDDSLLAANSLVACAEQELETDHIDRLGLSDGAHAHGSESGVENRLGAKSSSSSMFGTTQAEGPVDEVKFAPPAREPPAPPSSITSISNDDVTTAGDWSAETCLASQGVEISSCGDAMLVVKMEDDSESTASKTPTPEADARTAPGENSRQRKRRTCPGSFPESRSGSLKSVVSA